MDFIDVGSLAILHKGIHLPDSQHRSRFEVKSPRMALTGDLPGGQETHSTGVSTGLQGWPAGPMGDLHGCECEEWTPWGGRGREELLCSPQLGTAVGVSEAVDPGPLSTVSQNKLGGVSQGSVCLSVHMSSCRAAPSSPSTAPPAFPR